MALTATLLQGMAAEDLLADGLEAAFRRRPRRRRSRRDRWPAQPVIYEVNTAVWLDELSRRGSALTLADVPGAATGTRSPCRASTRSG